MTEMSKDPALAPGMRQADGPTGIINTDYTIGRDNIEGYLGPFGFDIHNPIFAVSALSVIAFVVFTLTLPDAASAIFTWLFSAVTQPSIGFSLAPATFS